MKKFVVAKNWTFQALNYENKYSFFEIVMPIQYTYLDVLDIIKIYTGYENQYEYDFYSSFSNEYFSVKYKHKKFDDIEIEDFKDWSPDVICSYGPLKIKFGYRGSRKWYRVYPIVEEASGYYPDEASFSKLKDISSDILHKHLEENDEKIFWLASSLPERKKDDFISVNEKLKEHFKNKYKISDGINENWDCNKLVRK